MDISSRAIYSSSQVTDLVDAVLRLENLKGLERRRRLDEICHKSEDAQRIIKFHFGSLRKLALRHGIDPRVVADTIYRDEADVQHDLDMLERAGMTLCYRSLKQDHRLLYGVMRANGWGVERLRNPPRAPKWYPRHNPRSELLPDRMIAFRRMVRITRKTAAAMAGISAPTWRRAENGVSRPTGATRERILKLLSTPGADPNPLSPQPASPVPNDP